MMRVKELLLAALSRANHIEDGTPADARELSKARRFFNSALATYSDSNLITAFQRVVSVVGRTEQVIGAYNMKRGKVMHTANTQAELPDPTRLTVGKDYGYISSTKQYARVALTGTNAKVWSIEEASTERGALLSLGCCDYVPDVVVPEIERIVAAMFRPIGETGKFEKLDFVPLASFYIDGSDRIYCAVPDGDNKARLFLPEAMVGCDIRVVYNTSMKFEGDDYIELPEVYRELLTLAVTVALLSEDADSDPTQLNNYSKMLEKLEHQIGGNNVSTRRLVRDEQDNVTQLSRGSFIYRRFR